MFSARLGLFIQMATVAAFSVVMSTILIDLETATPQPVTQPSNNNPLSNVQLEVRPSTGQPSPLDTPLQGTPNQTNQNARGDLQQPQTVDQLQPNAGSDQIPQAFLE